MFVYFEGGERMSDLLFRKIQKYFLNTFCEKINLYFHLEFHCRRKKEGVGEGYMKFHLCSICINLIILIICVWIYKISDCLLKKKTFSDFQQISHDFWEMKRQVTHSSECAVNPHKALWYVHIALPSVLTWGTFALM